MKVVFASSEIAPYASTGGLGEVCRSLPAALRRLGCAVWRTMPMHRRVMEDGYAVEDTGLRLRIPVGFRVHPAEVWRDREAEVDTYFIRRDEYFDRREIYALPERDYADNFERFVFFQKSVVALIDALDLKPDLVHGNDWVCGLIPLFLRHGNNGAGRQARERAVFTLHNLAYQGLFPSSEFPLTNLPYSCFSIPCMEFFGNINCLKAGLTTSALSTTVSRSYAREIRTREMGYGLDGVLTQMGDRMVGIQNGVDYSVWNPSTDRYLPARYDADSLEGKRSCRAALLARIGVAEASPGTAVIGMITRLVAQKGMDILAEAMPAIMEKDLVFVLLGSGQEEYHRLCREWQSRWPRRFQATIGYDQPLAHLIQGGADMLLMPSRYEPCGLSQLYAMRYGTIPLVHAVGGLNDSVTEVAPDGSSGNGFRFESYRAEEMLGALSKALLLFADRATWRIIQRRIMAEDHSWDRSAAEYRDLYASVLATDH